MNEFLIQDLNFRPLNFEQRPVEREKRVKIAVKQRETNFGDDF